MNNEEIIDKRIASIDRHIKSADNMIKGTDKGLLAIAIALGLGALGLLTAIAIDIYVNKMINF